MDGIAVRKAVEGGIPSEAELVQRAREMVPMLRARSAQATAERRVPKETIDAYREAGFFRMLQPKRFGGYEADYGTFCKVLEELAQGCGSSAWVCAKLAEHPWFISCFSEQAQLDVWGENPHALASASFAPRPMKTVPGGYRSTATYSFSSGCDHADWVYFGALTDKGVVFMLVPMTDLEVVDDWHVFGLQGTGSKSLKLNDVFIPEHRVVRAMDMAMGTAPGAAVHPDNYLSRAPIAVLAPYGTPSVAVGLAQRAVDVFVDAALKEMMPGGGTVAEQPVLQMEAGEAQGEIDMVRTTKHERVATAVAAIRAREVLTPRFAADTRRNGHLFAHRMVDVVVKICAVSNPRWVKDEDPRQLILRDVIAASAHRAAMWDGAMSAGRVMFGMQPIGMA